MPRNLDLTTLRSFITVADAGGVTRAAGALNLTQSAVSMQLKRLEEGLGLSLLDRSSRTMTLTPEGDQLAGYARRMLALNDEALGRLTSQDFTGEILLGVPHDIVYPCIPRVLRSFAAAYPRMQVQLVSSYTRSLREGFARGDIDMILTTEDGVGEGGETLTEVPLIWVGAPEGQAWKQRPLRLAFEQFCIFRPSVQQALDAAGIPWDMAVQSDSTRTVEATVSADLAVHALIEGMEPPYIERIHHQGTLPDLRQIRINLYTSELAGNEARTALAEMIRTTYRSSLPERPRLAAQAG
ncbi:MAG: LysR family transcriptional regulator [Celeribacter sp.]|jgi:DNA-binding transcriptional LysR family regulator